MLKLGVLTSGTGTNLQAIIDAIENKKLDAEIKLVISNNKSQSLDRAKNHGIRNARISEKMFDTRVDYDRALQYALEGWGVEFVVLAGFMRILSSEFVNAFKDKIINIHPSLLPSFPGLDAQRQAIEHGVKITGCTVHFVDEGLDSGPIIYQKALNVNIAWDREQLAKHLIKIEHKSLVHVLQAFSENRVHLTTLDGNRIAYII